MAVELDAALGQADNVAFGASDVVLHPSQAVPASDLVVLLGAARSASAPVAGFETVNDDAGNSYDVAAAVGNFNALATLGLARVVNPLTTASSFTATPPGASLAPAIVAASFKGTTERVYGANSATASSSDVSVALTQDANRGDLILAGLVYEAANFTIPTPAGWTLIGATADTDAGLYYKVAASSGPASITSGLHGIPYSAAVICAVRAAGGGLTFWM